jgi:hypothetical protein
MPRRRRLFAGLLALLAVFGVVAVSATACEGGGGGGGELTSLATKLSGEGKEGETITVLEGSKVKDKATLSGKNASKATGKVTYKVYSDKECKTPVVSAGEVTVSGESVPVSSEETLTAGTSYYWQAHYSGDANNAESTSPCTEISSIKAATSLSTKLSGESKEAEELTVLEGSKVKDKATLSGTNSFTAGGKVAYKVFSDSKCEHLVAEAGEVTVTAGSIPLSNEELLAGGASYYWQASYNGDTLHQTSTSACGREIATIKAKTSLSTTLSGEGKEGGTITVLEGAKVKDKATLSGTNSASASGKILYKVYSDSGCQTLVKEAGEVTVTSGSVPASTEEQLAGGAYYWQATYSGDALHQASTSICGSEVETVKTTTSLTTSLSGEGKSGVEIQVQEEAAVTDVATLGGQNAFIATGTVKYAIYSDNACKTLVSEAGEVSVAGEHVPASGEKRLPTGIYYWQATYSGDARNQGSKSTCGVEVEIVLPPPPRMEQVDFINNLSVRIDHEQNVVPEAAKEITEFGQKNEVEWESPPQPLVGKNWPVAYVQDTKIKLAVRVALDAVATQTFLKTQLEGEPTVTGETTLGGVKLTFTAKFPELGKQLTEHDTYLDTEDVEADNPLPSKVSLYEGASITWKWKGQEKVKRPFEQTLGKSTHNFYVTFAPPIEAPIYLTLLDLDTLNMQKAVQPLTYRSALEGVWAGFSTSEAGIPSVHLRTYNPVTGAISRTGLVLKYYYEIPPGKKLKDIPIPACKGLTATELLANGASECSAWAEAFGVALANEGIHSRGPIIQAKGKACVAGGCVFLVKNWGFAGGIAGRPFPYPWNEVTDLDGIPGQGVKNPHPWFWSHVIVEVSYTEGAGERHELYDPSYGVGPYVDTTTPKLIKDYQTASVDGFCIPTGQECQTTAEAAALGWTELFENGEWFRF